MIQYKAGERHGAKHLNPFYLNMERMTHIMEEQKNLIWKDRKRVLGMPLTFTKYSLSEDRIFLQTGFLNLEEEEILLYRVRDLSVKRSLGQRIFGVGSVLVFLPIIVTLFFFLSILEDTGYMARVAFVMDMPHLVIKNVKRPGEVKERIHQQVEKMKVERRMRLGELMHDDDCDDMDLGQEEF